MTFLLYSTLLLAAAGEERHPALHFDAAALPALRQRCLADENTWPRLQRAADDLLKPGAVDPAAIATVGADRPQNVRGHFIGRQLTASLEPLGFAYQITGDERYARLGTRVLVEAARRLPPDAPPVGPGSFAGARGDIVRAMTSGYDWLYPTLSEPERAEVANALAAYVRNILDEAEGERCWWVPHHNFIGVAVGASGRAALALQGRFPGEAPAWRDRAAKLIRTWLDQGFDEKGAYYEGVLYAFYGLDNGVLFADALKRAGGSDLFTHPRLRATTRFFAHSLLPGEAVFDALNDSSYAGTSSATLLRLAAEGDGLARWLWERVGGADGVSPYHLVWANDTAPVSPERAGLGWAEHFPGRGLAVFRTGWGPDDVMLSLESGPFYKVTHNQADKCQATFYGMGGRWLIDSGYGNNRDPEGKAQTVAHNLVLVDGKGQALSGAGGGTNGRILAFQAAETHGYVLGDATEAYQRNSSGQPGVALQRAHRHAVFVRPAGGHPAYALLVDTLRVDGKPHTFDWLLHTDADNELSLREGEVTLRATHGASGGAYVETPLESEGRGSLEFPVTLERAGRYRVWARVRACPPELGRSDSFFVQWDDGEPVAWHAPSVARWTWGAVSEFGAREPLEFALSAGAHRLSILTREAGAAIDRVVVTADPAWAPQAGRMEGAGLLALEAEAAGKVVAPMVVRREPATAAGAECLVRWLLPEKPALACEPYMDHPRVRARWAATDPSFATLVYPRRAGTPAPRAAVSREGERLRVILSWGAAADEITVWLDGSRPAEVKRNP